MSERISERERNALQRTSPEISAPIRLDSAADFYRDEKEGADTAGHDTLHPGFCGEKTETKETGRTCVETRAHSLRSAQPHDPTVDMSRERPTNTRVRNKKRKTVQRRCRG